jgi:hypothetical protein
MKRTEQQKQIFIQNIKELLNLIANNKPDEAFAKYYDPNIELFHSNGTGYKGHQECLEVVKWFTNLISFEGSKLISSYVSETIDGEFDAVTHTRWYMNYDTTKFKLIGDMFMVGYWKNGKIIRERVYAPVASLTINKEKL